MCDACDEFERDRSETHHEAGRWSRRSLFRSMAAGSALTLTAPLWLPATAYAGGEGEPEGDGESAAMGEDVMPEAVLRPSSSASGASTSKPATSAAGGTAVKRVSLTRTIPAPRATKINPPPIVTRAQWGADDDWRGPERTFAPIRKLIVHHTASPNKPRSPVSVVRDTYRYHAVLRNYTDIGYNYMIDHKGVIYEGRFARRYGDEPITGEDRNGWGVVGAHAKGMNAGACGICLIGNFEEAAPTDAALASLQWLLAWKAARHRIDVLDSDPYVNIYGQWFDSPNLAGHRNVGLTLCPGARLYKQLGALRRNVAAQAGRWDRMVVDIPGVLRYEYGRKGAAPGSVAEVHDDARSSTASGSTSSSGGGSTTTAGSKVVGLRAITTGGTVMTIGDGTKHGNASTYGTIAGFAGRGRGDGYAVVTTKGKVVAFGGLDVSGSIPSDQTAADIDVTPSGAGCWVLARNGGIYPFGDAGYYGSPRKAGVDGGARRIAARPGGDGYWVLGDDGKVRGYGAAKSYGSPSGGTAVDIAATPTGKGYLVLLADGDVIAFGDAVDKGGIPSVTKRWAKPAAAIATMPSGSGYVLSSHDGGLYSFGNAPYFGSFAGSGATVTGLVVSCA